MNCRAFRYLRRPVGAAATALLASHSAFAHSMPSTQQPDADPHVTLASSFEHHHAAWTGRTCTGTNASCPHAQCGAVPRTLCGLVEEERTSATQVLLDVDKANYEQFAIATSTPTVLSNHLPGLCQQHIGGALPIFEDVGDFVLDHAISIAGQRAPPGCLWSYFSIWGQCMHQDGSMIDAIASKTGRAIVDCGRQLGIIAKEGNTPLPYLALFNEEGRGICQQYRNSEGYLHCCPVHERGPFGSGPMSDAAIKGRCISEGAR